jgi:Protein of unknown function DUF262/Protein of unknown function (DUF1524)
LESWTTPQTRTYGWRNSAGVIDNLAVISDLALNYDFTGIGKLLLDRRMAVPRYQRSYSWKIEEVQELWDDLQRAIDENAPEYFLGTVVFSRDEASQTGDLPAVIDGQQRLATASLLLVALRDAFIAQGKEKRVEIVERFLLDWDTRSLELEPRLTLNEENREYFEGAQLPKPAERATLDARGPSNKRIEKAAGLLQKQVAELIADSGSKWEEELVELQLYIQDRAKVVVLDVPDEANAYLIFETLNDRGLDLTIADLLKNYLFSRAGKRIDAVKQNWDQALGALERGDDDKLQTTFLRHYWSSHYGYTREKMLYRSIKTEVTNQTAALKLSSDLATTAAEYSAIRNPTHNFWTSYPSPPRANLETLLLLDVSQSRPLLLAVMQQWKPANVAKTLKYLVACSVRLIVVRRAGTGPTEKAFSEAAVEVRKGKIKDAKALAATLSAVVPDDGEFEAAFSVMSKKARHARYFLHAMQRHLDRKKAPEMITNADETQVNLEHILPRDYDPALWPQFNAEQHAELFHRLGNEVLLNARENGAVGAEGFKDKAAIYKGSPLSLTADVATHYSDWTPEAIEERGRNLARHAVKTWSV